MRLKALRAHQLRRDEEVRGGLWGRRSVSQRSPPRAELILRSSHFDWTEWAELLIRRAGRSEFPACLVPGAAAPARVHPVSKHLATEMRSEA